MGEVTNLKKVLFFSVLILMCVFDFPVEAKYGGGSGTVEDPYRIYDANQMNAIGANSGDWNKHFILMADIDLSAFTGTEFNVIGTSRNPFTGTFDGHGFEISNFTYVSTGSNWTGLFGHIIGQNAQVKNLGLIEPHFDAGEGVHVGALVG